MEVNNKTVVAVPFILVIISALALLSPNLMLLVRAQDPHAVHSDTPSLLATQLHLPADKINIYLEHELGIRNSQWLAGPAQRLP